MRTSNAFRNTLSLLTLAGLLAFWNQSEFYGHDILAEVAIYAILAISLDIVAGYGGMVSLGHGALFGFGAYMYALFAVKWNMPALLAVLPASLLVGVVALWVGALINGAREIIFATMSAAVVVYVAYLLASGSSLGPLLLVLPAYVITAVLVRRLDSRSSGVHGIFFIMITLAIGEMGHEFFFQSPAFGGDDGFAGLPRPDLTALGIDLVDPAIFSALLLAALVLVYLLCQHVMQSPYGMALRGLHENESRMRALGLPTRTYKTTAIGFSGIIAGFAGTLAAMHSQFITPALLSWQNSGEVLIMVILGGLGTLVGAVIGAIAVILFKRYDICPSLPLLPEHDLCPNPDFWHFWLGLILILVVITRSNGVVGVLHGLWRRRHRGKAGG